MKSGKIAGLVVATFALCGCETSRCYSPTCAGAPYARGTVLPCQSRVELEATNFAVAQPAEINTFKTEPVADVKLASATSPVSIAGAPMLTITIPSVKLTVPINATLSYPQPIATGVANPGWESPAISRAASTSGLPIASPVMHSASAVMTAPLPQSQYSQSTFSSGIPSMTSASGATVIVNPDGQCMTYVRRPQPLATKYIGQTSSQDGYDDGIRDLSPCVTAPPPVWPSNVTTADDESASDPSFPPPIHRNPFVYGNPSP
jgi:hypothetical protein